MEATTKDKLFEADILSKRERVERALNHQAGTHLQPGIPRPAALSAREALDGSVAQPWDEGHLSQ